MPIQSNQYSQNILPHSPAKNREEHRLELEKKNDLIKNLEEDFSSNQSLRQLKRQVAELSWELQTAPGVPPQVVVRKK
jgi:hypothetical protein